MERNTDVPCDPPPNNVLIDLVTVEDSENDLSSCRSFVGSSFNPIVDLCTQVTGGGDIAPIKFDQSVSGTLQTDAPIPPEMILRGHFTSDRKLASNRIRQQRHRSKLQHQKIDDREEIAELVSNFIAPNQGYRQQ